MTEIERLREREGVLARADAEPLGAAEFQTVRENIRSGRDRWVGALVRDARGRVPLVQNRWSDGWVLPGGTVEPGERLREAAVREVREETGLDARVERPLEVVERTFTHDGGAVTGHFVVFEARTDDSEFGDDLGVDDAEIAAAKWFDAVPDRCEDAGILRRHL